MIILMRTTLDIDLDVLEAAKEIASRSKKTAGEIISDLLRRALTMERPSPASTGNPENGFEVIPAAGRIVTQELIRQLQEESETA
jgi:negative regulator of replication initiation